MKKNYFPLVLLSLLSLAVWGQNERPVSASGVISHEPWTNPANLVTCDGVLADYANIVVDPAGGVTSQNFEPSNDHYDSQAADDFVAPGSGQSTICQVVISGSFSAGGFAADPGSQILLTLYDDAGGVPGTMIFSETFPAPTDASFVLEPTGSPNLMGGTTYWLSVQATLNFSVAGQWFWDTAMDGNGYIYAWQNPGDGFGYGCVSWTPHSDCSLAGEADLMMEISFNEALGIDSLSMESAIGIFPNPAKNEFTVRSNLPLETLTIFDVRGRVVGSADLLKMSIEKAIDISALDAGMYLIQISGKKGTVVKNLLKQ